jgi:hypothetical protein
VKRHNARAAEIKAKGLKESDSFTIGCVGRDVRHERLRRQWEMITSMHSTSFCWTYQTDEKARRRDDLKHAGRTDYNQESLNQDIWPQTTTASLLRMWEATDPDEYTGKDPSIWFDELSNPRKVGRLVANIVATDLFPVRWSVCLCTFVYISNQRSAAQESRGPLRFHCMGHQLLSITAVKLVLAIKPTLWRYL